MKEGRVERGRGLLLLPSPLAGREIDMYASVALSVMNAQWSF